MILHYFKNKENKENKDKKIADFLYLDIINSSKNIINYNIYNTSKGFDVSFEINSILLLTIFIGSKKRYKKDWTGINQDLMNIYIRDLDHSMSLLGISDMKIGKYVKEYVRKFYFRVKKFEKIYQIKDFNIFYKYFLTLKILEKQDNPIFDHNEDKEILENFFLDLRILLKRSQILKNERLLFKDLFK
jgi:hypothetical protein